MSEIIIYLILSVVSVFSRERSPPALQEKLISINKTELGHTVLFLLAEATHGDSGQVQSVSLEISTEHKKSDLPESWRTIGAHEWREAAQGINNSTPYSPPPEIDGTIVKRRSILGIKLGGITENSKSHLNIFRNCRPPGLVIVGG